MNVGDQRDGSVEAKEATRALGKGKGNVEMVVEAKKRRLRGLARVKAKRKTNRGCWVAGRCSQEQHRESTQHSTVGAEQPARESAEKAQHGSDGATDTDVFQRWASF